MGRQGHTGTRLQGTGGAPHCPVTDPRCEQDQGRPKRPWHRHVRQCSTMRYDAEGLSPTVHAEAPLPPAAHILLKQAAVQPTAAERWMLHASPGVDAHSSWLLVRGRHPGVGRGHRWPSGKGEWGSWRRCPDAATLCAAALSPMQGRAASSQDQDRVAFPQQQVSAFCLDDVVSGNRAMPGAVVFWGRA